MMNKKSRNNFTNSIRAQIIDMPSTQPITSVHIIPQDLPTFQAGALMETPKVKQLGVEENGRLVITACGKLCGPLTQTDILIAVKKKLQDEENKNLSLLEKFDNSIFTLGLEGKLTYANLYGRDVTYERTAEDPVSKKSIPRCQ